MAKGKLGRSEAHVVLARPLEQDEGGPDAREVEAGPLRADVAPEGGDGRGIEAEVATARRIEERRFDALTQPFAHPSLDWEHEAALRPFEELLLEPTHRRVAQRELLAERREARFVRQRGRCCDDGVID